jgi:glutamate dehydrogenase
MELLEMRQAGRGIPRPLLCVLLGYSKMHSFDALLQTDFTDSPAGRPFLDHYFPQRLREGFSAYFRDHVLRREIIATGAVNYVINRGGITLLPRLMAAGKASLGRVMEAYVTADGGTDAPRLREQIVAAGISAREEHSLLLDVEKALESCVTDLLAGKIPDLSVALDAVRSRVPGA